MEAFNVLQTNLKINFIESEIIKPAILADCARVMSFQHSYKLKKIYSDIIGRLGVDHFSINAVSKDTGMLIFSKAPSFGYNLYKNKSGIILDTAISPTFYENLEYYFWDDCYPISLYKRIIKIKEQKHNFTKGVVFVRKIQEIYFLYSFATKGDALAFIHNAKRFKELFFQMGDYCLNRLLPIYEMYVEHTLDDILKFFKPKNSSCNDKFRPRIILL